MNEGEGHELGEVTGLLLQRARANEVRGPTLGSSDATEHERDFRSKPDLVAHAVNLEPLIRVDLVGTENGSYLVVENLRRGAGKSLQTGVLQPREVRREILFRASSPFEDLERANGGAVNS